ncbi:SPL family radical SAM protein [Planctomicrobium piriforme]|uniref:Radical SAM core domain-containing protein n=1 Tax=Planctomicrobium piriforme TaxID=1576369 RepID=A0A1I3E8G2_9PLAN|nr:radical SAM protein [Planctomicrobium piriforme]SFH95001.1 hypothetical protein SAMN05421753_104112 [Planctomicrobium piriforme]
MPVDLTLTTVKNVLTRTSGYLSTIASHSLQPYRGCTFGNALCGVGCYVRHNGHILQGRNWGSFLEVRTNAADSYRNNFAREANWARRERGVFSIFCSSSTDPFVPQEKRYQITRQLLGAMLELPPDELILQTHSPAVADALPLLAELNTKCRLRIHVSIETDQDRLPGLPPPTATVAARLQACQALKNAGIRTVVTVAPLLPLADPLSFFERIAENADSVVIDHFIEGDGSPTGNRTFRTPLPAAMAAINPRSITLAYRDEIVAIARQVMPGRVGVSIEGFAGRFSTP